MKVSNETIFAHFFVVWAKRYTFAPGFKQCKCKYETIHDDSWNHTLLDSYPIIHFHSILRKGYASRHTLFISVAEKQFVSHSQKENSNCIRESPQTAGDGPLPTVYRQDFPRRAADLYHFPYHIIYRTFFLCHERTVSLNQQPFSFTTEDAMKHMLAPVAEQYHIHRLQRFGATETWSCLSDGSVRHDRLQFRFPPRRRRYHCPLSS